MRLVQVTIPAGKRDAVTDVLDDSGVDYVLTDETSGRRYTSVAYFPLPTEAVEPVLDDLNEIALDDEAYTVVVNAETVVSRQFEELKERYQERGGEGSSETRIAQQELRSRAEELAPTLSTYITLTVISTVVATAGLLLDSPATVVGSMVIAPLVGPAMASSVGTVINDRELFLKGAKLQAIGLPIAVISSLIFAYFVKSVHLVPPALELTSMGEISERVAPGLLTLAVALGAGIAGAVSLSAGVSTAIVGVMIAVALIPPAAVVGIGIAWGLPLVSLGAAVLTLVNGLSINLTAIGTLWHRNYSPSHTHLRNAARNATLKRVLVLVLVIVLLSSFLVGVTYNSYRQGTTTQDVKQAVEEVTANHESIVLLNTRVQYEEGSFFTSPERVSVVVGMTPDTEPPEISGQLKQRIDAITGGNVTVVVRYVTIERSGPRSPPDDALDSSSMSRALAAPHERGRLATAGRPSRVGQTLV